jgi:hypothetical protein
MDLISAFAFADMTGMSENDKFVLNKKYKSETKTAIDWYEELNPHFSIPRLESSKADFTNPTPQAPAVEKPKPAPKVEPTKTETKK